MHKNSIRHTRLSILATLFVLGLLTALMILPSQFYSEAANTAGGSTPTQGSSSFIYDNGPLSTGPTTNSGVAAPTGTNWSEVQNNTGNTTVTNASAGANCSRTATLTNRCADNFVVPAGETWTIDQVSVAVYQTGFAGTTSPVVAGTLQIWSGRPGGVGAAVIFGDTTTNRLGASTDTSIWRIFNTTVPAPGTPPATNRKIWDTRLTVSPAQVLGPGTYWVDWQTQIETSTTHFAPTVTIQGMRGRPGDNARQFTAAGWLDVVDGGDPVTPPTVPQDFPFKLVGTITSGPSTGDGRADFDGDGRTDLSVFRSTEGNWYLQRSTAGFQVLNWGIATDTIVPGDYDGDGKDDLAVFRPDANSVNPDFYMLNSNGFVFTGVSWGIPGDVPANADYDGDGEYDIAIYRASEGNWYVLVSGNGGYFIVNNPGTTPAPGDYDGDGEPDTIIFTNGTWIGPLSGGGTANVALGQAGDIPVPGDYDGDGTDDIAVFRPANGTWFVRQSSNSQVVATAFGISTDIPAPGDYDGDGKDDQAIYRNGQWWLNRSTAGVGVFGFGLATDAPIPTAARP